MVYFTVFTQRPLKSLQRETAELSVGRGATEICRRGPWVATAASQASEGPSMLAGHAAGLRQVFLDLKEVALNTEHSYKKAT